MTSSAAPSFLKNSFPEKNYFKTVVIVVTLLHLVVISFLFWGKFSKPSQQKITLLQLLPQGALVKGSPTANPSSTPVKTAPTPPQKTTQKPITSPPSTPVKTKPSSTSINLKEVKRQAATKPAVAPNLKTVSRPATPTDQSASRSPSPSSQASASQIKNRLQNSIGKAGVMNATADGQSGAWNGSSSSEASSYFALIRDVYYQVWQQPTPDLSQKWATVLKIRVNKQGNILSATIEQNSGYPPLDQSVKQVARLVKTIGAPLPDVLGNQFADISIVFEF